jgi:hypothetical protein
VLLAINSRLIKLIVMNSWILVCRTLLHYSTDRPSWQTASSLLVCHQEQVFTLHVGREKSLKRCNCTSVCQLVTFASKCLFI